MTATLAPTPSRTEGDPNATHALPPKIDVSGVNFYYGAHQALHDISLKIEPNQVTALKPL